MVGHQRIGVDLQAEPPHGPVEDIQEELAVKILLEDRSSPRTSGVNATITWYFANDVGSLDNADGAASETSSASFSASRASAGDADVPGANPAVSYLPLWGKDLRAIATASGPSNVLSSSRNNTL